VRDVIESGLMRKPISVLNGWRSAARSQNRNDRSRLEREAGKRNGSKNGSVLNR
jgi:hypothetical protein